MFDRVCDPNSVVLKGRVKSVVRGPGGDIKQTLESNNVICTNGKDFLANFLSSAAAAASTFTMRYVAVGSDSTAETAADTALGIEVGRHTGTVSYLSGAIYQVTATFPTGVAAGAITEYGILSSNTAGTLLGRLTSSVVNVGSNDTLTVTYQITLS